MKVLIRKAMLPRESPYCRMRPTAGCAASRHRKAVEFAAMHPARPRRKRHLPTLLPEAMRRLSPQAGVSLFAAI
jgi:hypothetical protein